ncbi:MAG: LysR family transcriptional regulator [Kofleriaceae bacterium]|nr:LysR family transcriptional regulator [Kofleriaceae bacterium]
MLDELRHFLLIVDHGTFTEAARRAHLSQPALTAAIRRLEDQLGARLLHRGPGGAALTAAGAVLVPRARAALAAVEDGRRAVEEIAGLRAGEVRLGAGATACTYLLPPLLARFRRAHPGVRLLLREGFTDQLEAGLFEGDLDLALTTAPTHGPAPGPFDPWIDDELIVVGGPGPDAERAGWVTFPPGSPVRALLQGGEPDAALVMELGSIAAVKGNVRAGIGLALVSRAAVRADLTSGQLVEVARPWAPVWRRLILRHRGLDRLTPAAAALRELLLAATPTLAATTRRPRRGGRPRRTRARADR